jgi:MFS family permease
MADTPRAAGAGAMLRLSALVGERALFENDAYRKLWLAKLLSATPANAVVYTMLLLVVNATGNSFSSSLFVAAYIAPTALLGTVSGVFVDRAPKGLLLALVNAARVAFCLLLAISTDNVAIIYIIAVLFAVAGQFSGPAEAAALPAVVPPEDFTAANSLGNLGGLMSQVAGIMVLPALFLKTVGAEALAVVCAVMFGAAAFNFLLIEGLGGPVSDVRMSIEDARERFAQAWHRLTLDSVSYISVVIMVVANTVGLIVATLIPRFASQVLHVNTENAIFVVTPAAVGIWLALRFVRGMAGRVSPWWSVGGSFAAMTVGVVLCGFVRPMGDQLESWNLFGAFDPGPFGDGTARIIITMALGLGLAFTFTFVNVVARSVVNERMPRDMQGRVFAAQGVLTNLLSIPPILFAGLLADLTTVTFVFVLVGVLAGLSAVLLAARNLASPTRTAL